MSDALEMLLPMIDPLSAEDRIQLMDYLSMTSEPGIDQEFNPEEWDPEFAAEIERRIEDSRNGRSKTTPADEVFRQVDEMLNAKRSAVGS